MRARVFFSAASAAELFDGDRNFGACGRAFERHADGENAFSEGRFDALALGARRNCERALERSGAALDVAELTALGTAAPAANPDHVVVNRDGLVAPRDARDVELDAHVALRFGDVGGRRPDRPWLAGADPLTHPSEELVSRSNVPLRILFRRELRFSGLERHSGQSLIHA